MAQQTTIKKAVPKKAVRKTAVLDKDSALGMKRARAAALKKRIKAAKKELREIRKEVKAAKKAARKRLKEVRARAKTRRAAVAARARQQKTGSRKAAEPADSAKAKAATRKTTVYNHPLPTLEAAALRRTPRVATGRKTQRRRVTDADAPPVTAGDPAGSRAATRTN